MSYCASLCYILIYVCDLDQHLFKSLFSPKYIFALKLVCPPVSLSLLGFLRVANSFKLALIYLCLKLIIGLPTLCLLYTRSTQHTDVTISPPHIGGQRKFGGYIDPMYIHYFFSKMLASNNFITTSIDLEKKRFPHPKRMLLFFILFYYYFYPVHIIVYLQDYDIFQDPCVRSSQIQKIVFLGS